MFNNDLYIQEHSKSPFHFILFFFKLDFPPLNDGASILPTTQEKNRHGRLTSPLKKKKKGKKTMGI